MVFLLHTASNKYNFTNNNNNNNDDDDNDNDNNNNNNNSNNNKKILFVVNEAILLQIARLSNII